MPSGAAKLSSSRIGRRAGAVARAARGASALPVVGIVDEVTPPEVAGWLRLPQGSDPALVELHLGNVRVTWTYTSPQPPPHERRSRPGARRRAAQAWRNDRFVGLAKSRHTVAGEIHTFSFRLHELWPYARRSTRISVRVGGSPLPIAGHGMFMSPPVDGPHSPQDLRRLLDSGYVLNQRGKLTLSKDADVEWQRAVTRLHQRVRAVLGEQHGLDVFLMYGSLLGAVREGGPIGHDDDLDVAYLSAHRDGPAVAAEMERVALTLIHQGLEVTALPTHLAISDPDDPGHRIDLFNCYFDDVGEIAFPFGVAGTAAYTRRDWQGLEPMTFLGERALVPVAAERFLDHVYGDDWRRPRPGFRWTRSRTRAAQDARLDDEHRTRVHWANFYSRHGFEQGSTFSAFVLERPDIPRNVLEIGCGDGRDACALGSAGRRVLALDASAEGIERARTHAEALGLGAAVSFSVCDAGDKTALRSHVEELRRSVDSGPITCYMRFFLHAIPDDVQDGLLQTLHECAHPEDALVVEFRTVADQKTKKAHGEHYRRYVDAERLRDDLEKRHGFVIDHFEEGRGLSPYGEEDPVLCRIVAHRARD